MKTFEQMLYCLKEGLESQLFEEPQSCDLWIFDMISKKQFENVEQIRVFCANFLFPPHKRQYNLHLINAQHDAQEDYVIVTSEINNTESF